MMRICIRTSDPTVLTCARIVTHMASATGGIILTESPEKEVAPRTWRPRLVLSLIAVALCPIIKCNFFKKVGGR